MSCHAYKRASSSLSDSRRCASELMTAVRARLDGVSARASAMASRLCIACLVALPLSLWFGSVAGGAAPPCEASHGRTAYLVSAATGAVTSAFPDTDVPASTAVSDGRGGWYVAGGFRCVGGIRAAAVVRLRADGRLDRAWRPGVLPELIAPDGGLVAAVAAMVVDRDIVYLASSAGVHALDSRTGRRLWFAPIASGSGDQIATSLAIDGASLYVGGRFTRIAGKALRTGGFAVLSIGDGRFVRGAPDHWKVTGDVDALQVSGRRLFVLADLRPEGRRAAVWLAAFRLPSLRPTTWQPRTASGRLDRDDIGADTMMVADRAVWASGHHGFRVYDMQNGRSRTWDARFTGISSVYAAYGDRVYVSGGCRRTFSEVDGQWRDNLAVLGAADGRLQAWAPTFPRRFCANAIAADAQQVLLVGWLSDVTCRRRDDGVTVCS